MSRKKNDDGCLLLPLGIVFVTLGAFVLSVSGYFDSSTVVFEGGGLALLPGTLIGGIAGLAMLLLGLYALVAGIWAVASDIFHAIQIVRKNPFE